MQPKIENEFTFLVACRKQINLFAGAGFSILARDAAGKTLPLGSKLRAELLAEFDLSDLDDLSLTQICTILEVDRRDALHAYIKKRFSVAWFDDAYAALGLLKIKSIITTNVDDLFAKIFEGSKDYYINDLANRGPATNKRGIDFVALHGSVLHRDDAFVFGASDLAAAFSSDPDKWHVLTGQLQAAPTLFWGYSVEDAGTLQALNKETTKGRALADRWIVLHEPDTAHKQYFKALGFQIIESDTRSMLDYVAERLADDDTASTGRSTADLFPEAMLPPRGRAPVRPILEFYRGAAPTWDDIYENRIVRTHHYASIQNLINAGRSAIVVGIPACGKSTLMMQLAYGVDFDGHKLVYTAMPGETAKFLIRSLEGEPALIFIDDFADSVESFDILAGAPAVTVVGFDLDVNYTTGSHLLRRNIPVVDVSDLSPRDIQDIYDRIPIQIRFDQYKAPAMVAGRSPSLFEVIESNISGPRLSERFGPVLKQLHAESQPLHDLLVMCCYVHHCRTPVSFDMALAFSRPLRISIDELYERFDRLKNLIVDVSHDLVDADQDYFQPRSTVLASAIVNRVDDASLKRVIAQFHREVSSFRIYRYDILKRRALDAELIARAFADWRDGEQFYEAQYAKDPSPYVKQQCALYLGRKRRYKEAFRWIDEAVVESRYRIPSIRHTHATLLFRANINASESDGTRRATLDQSMEILKECHNYDQRKLFHAITFADQALEYHGVYGDDVARGYLQTSADWLREERRTNAWNRNVIRLLRDVERRLRS